MIAKPDGKEHELISDYKTKLGELFNRSASLYSLERYAKSQPLVVSAPDSDAEMAIRSSNENADFESDPVIVELMKDPVYKGKILSRTLTENEYRGAEDMHKQLKYGLFSATNGQEVQQEIKDVQSVAQQPNIEISSASCNGSERGPAVNGPKTNGAPVKRHREVRVSKKGADLSHLSKQMRLRLEEPLQPYMSLTEMVNEGLARPEGVSAFDLKIACKVYPPSVKIRNLTKM